MFGTSRAVRIIVAEPELTIGDKSSCRGTAIGASCSRGEIRSSFTNRGNDGFCSRISACFLLASIVVTSFVILTTAAKATAASPTINSHWAGFVTEDTSQPDVRGTFGKWVVPSVTCGSSETSSSVTWVGIGGALNPKGNSQGEDEALYQVGTGSNCINGTQQYLAWVEDTGLPHGFDSVFDFDQDPHVVVLGCQTNIKCSDALSVEPGDTIAAAVVDHSVYTRWTISDERRGRALWSHTKTWLTHAHRHSGECIEEDPQLSNGSFGAMSDFGSVTFSSCQVSDPSGKVWAVSGSHLPKGWTTVSYAVGNGTMLVANPNENPLRVTWIGWSPPTALTSAGLELTSISCVSSKFCMAVGDTYGPNAANDTTPSYAAYTWDGSSWSQAPYIGLALPSGLSSEGWFTSVSCVSSSMCLASYLGMPPLNSSDIGENVYGAVEWNGSAWEDTGFQYTQDQLNGLDCVTRHWCMAVIDPGQDVAGSGQAMSAVWNGKIWTTERIGSLDVPGFTTFALSCPTDSFCMTTTNAYGEIMDSADSPTQENSSYEWNGSTWNEVSWPTQAVGVDSLSCATSTFCIQLATPNEGTSGYKGGDVQFNWNGKEWSKNLTPLPGQLASSALSCVSSSLCVAVGGETNGPPILPEGSGPPVADFWDGESWHQMQWPSVASGAALADVSCGSSGECGTVGSVASISRLEP